MKLARLAPVVALAALVGCSPSPTVAADVAGTVITRADLDASYRGCASLGYDIPVNGILSLLVLSEALDVTAREAGVPLTDEEIAGAAAANPELAGPLSDEGCARAARTSVALGLLSQKMDPEKILAAVTAMDIRVNPRFGQWDPTKATVDGSGSLSVLANH